MSGGGKSLTDEMLDLTREASNETYRRIARRIVTVMNEALKADHDCIEAMLRTRLNCNQALAEHPSIQVACYNDPDPPTVSLLGVLNGLAGTFERKGVPGWGRVCARYEVACAVHGEKREENKGLVIGEQCQVACGKEACGKKLELGTLVGFELTDGQDE